MNNGVQQNLESRVTQIERELAEIKAILVLKKGDDLPWWERIAGRWEGEEFDEIVEEIRKNRQKDHEAAVRAANAREAKAKHSRKQRTPIHKR